ncbi:nitrogen fixation protein NifW [Neiella sp. HB171785]|uniref:Nitrogen fixation protein NifW n=1 Tax=Neiella litorisoli TaxID=2771431 RepID=A0A8J6QR67_9GAMM|nr:nitrogen fixation protein NifW [Neiella litorisoli]MBD1389901.1 nitrogen fixation protein NifW [Neiella litorisoli]
MQPKDEIANKINQMKSLSELMAFFDIGCDSQFLQHYGEALKKRFWGNVLIAKPDNWFGYRRALKSAYCKIQRNRQNSRSETRRACTGCTSCERR